MIQFIRRRRYLVASLVALVVLVVLGLRSLAAPKPPQYISARVERGDLENTVLATGTLGAVQQVDVGAQVTGQLKSLKVKLGGENDAARIRAVRDAAPGSRLILDANEGWTDDNVAENIAAAAALGVALIEQPLPAGRDGKLRHISRPIPICADESVHAAEDIEALVGLYDAVNIKLDKAGGLTEAIKLRDRAREAGLGVMVGCMVGTSLAMAPAILLAQGADYVDLDGPLLLSRDREPGLAYQGSLVSPPDGALWG